MFDCSQSKLGHESTKSLQSLIDNLSSLHNHSYKPSDCQLSTEESTDHQFLTKGDSQVIDEAQKLQSPYINLASEHKRSQSSLEENDFE